MGLHLRIHRLERERATRRDGRRGCRVCDDGALLASVARFEDYPASGQRGATRASVCAACGRECAEPVLVRGIDPELL